MTYPSIEVDGKKIELSDGNYIVMLQHPVCNKCVTGWLFVRHYHLLTRKRKRPEPMHAVMSSCLHCVRCLMLSPSPSPSGSPMRSIDGPCPSITAITFTLSLIHVGYTALAQTVVWPYPGSGGLPGRQRSGCLLTQATRELLGPPPPPLCPPSMPCLSCFTDNAARVACTRHFFPPSLLHCSRFFPLARYPTRPLHRWTMRFLLSTSPLLLLSRPFCFTDLPLFPLSLPFFIFPGAASRTARCASAPSWPCTTRTSASKTLSRRASTAR